LRAHQGFGRRPATASTPSSTFHASPVTAAHPGTARCGNCVVSRIVSGPR
jgi:hypothetical protein